jgi:hypothetical protein
MNPLLAPLDCASRSISMFAGSTATSRAIRPIAAMRRVPGSSSPTPPSTSNTPLRYTSISGLGSQDGMIAM